MLEWKSFATRLLYEFQSQVWFDHLGLLLREMESVERWMPTEPFPSKISLTPPENEPLRKITSSLDMFPGQMDGKFKHLLFATVTVCKNSGSELHIFQHNLPRNSKKNQFRR